MPRGSKPGERRGGRTAGTPNKDKQALLDLILSTGAKHPIEGMALAAVKAEEEGDNKLAFQAYCELAPYVAAKRKAIEVTGEDGEPIRHTLDASKLDSAALRAILSAQLPPDE